MEADGVRGSEVAWVSAAAAAFGIVFSYPLLLHLGGVSDLNDWDQDLQIHWAAYYSVVHYHQFPFWNPYKCGGIPLFANPHSRVLTPFFALHLLFGPFVGYQLEIPLHIALTFGGAYLLARVLRQTPVASAICATIFAGSSWFYLHLAVGHSPFFPMGYVPWMLALIWLAIEREALLPAAGAGAVVALMLFEGGVYVIPMAVMFAAIVASCLALMRRSWFPAAVLMVFVLCSIGFASVKLIPSYEVMLAHPRPMDSNDANSVQMLLRFLLSRDQGVYVEGTWGLEGSWEYGAYVGVLGALLALAGIVRSPRKALPWLVAGTIFFVIAMGQDAYPWELIHRLPILSEERAPSRFLLPLTLVIATLAAAGTDWMREKLGRAGTLVTAVVLAVMVADFWVVSTPALVRIVDGKIDVMKPSPDFQQTFTAFQVLPSSIANRGSVQCYDATDFMSAVVPDDLRAYRGEQYLFGGGSVTAARWSPNQRSYDIDVPAPTTVYINENYDRGWKVVRGPAAVAPSGLLLAIRVPAGKQQVTIRYRDPYLLPGAILSALTLLGMLGLWWFERRSRRVARA